jgi:hypothetical protein
MNNIRNYTNRQLCEYQSIFPTVAALLDQLLFTIGNGYDVNPQTGMIEDGDGVAITDYPEMTEERWSDLIKDCHANERNFAVRFAHGREIDEARLAEDCAAYKPMSVDDSAFSEEALYADLQKMQANRRADSYWRSEVWLRPYPLSEKYSDIYNLNENTPAWFLQIALNLTKAWIRFLTEALDANDVWTPPGTRKNKEVLDEETSNMLHEILNEINPGSANVEYKESESDYADATWTTKHRNMLLGVQQQLESYLANAKV